MHNLIIVYAVTFQTGMCPDGHYCPPGTGYPFTYPCQAGQYRNNTLNHSGEACVLCPPRHYCDRLGTHMPPVCPQVDFFQPFEKLCCCRYETVLAAFKCACKIFILIICVSSNRVFTAQKAHLLPNRVLKEPTVHVQLSVMGLSAPLVAEAGTALKGDSQSPLEAVKSASTVEREPSLL